MKFWLHFFPKIQPRWLAPKAGENTFLDTVIFQYQRNRPGQMPRASARTTTQLQTLWPFGLTTRMTLCEKWQVVCQILFGLDCLTGSVKITGSGLMELLVLTANGMKVTNQTYSSLLCSRQVNEWLPMFDSHLFFLLQVKYSFFASHDKIVLTFVR